MFSVIRFVAMLVASLHNASNASRIGYRLIQTLPPPKPPDSHIIKILLLLLSTNIVQHQYCGDHDDLIVRHL